MSLPVSRRESLGRTSQPRDQLMDISRRFEFVADERFPRPLLKQMSAVTSGSCPSSPLVKKSYRMVVLGSAKTGKTALVRRFLNNCYDDVYTPTIEDFHRKTYRIRGELFQLDILDTSGNGPFPAARRLCLLTGDLFLVVYNVDNVGSCDEAFRIYDQIVEVKVPDTSTRTHKIPILLVGNKTDLPTHRWETSQQEIRERLHNIVAPSSACSMVQCSAKSGEQIAEVFSTLFELAKLPKEMSPMYHKKLSINYSDNGLGGFKSPLMRLRSKPSDPSGYVVGVDQDARRPSLRTELLKAKKSIGTPKKPSSAANPTPPGEKSPSLVLPERGSLREKSPRTRRRDISMLTSKSTDAEPSDKSCCLQ